MKKNYRQDTTCLNCNFEVIGKFCGNCSQENIEIKENVGHMLSHAIGDYFHFESKFIKTMKPLFLRPGFLTNEYNAGKRTTYLPAIRMYIFTSIVFFLAVSLNQNKKETEKSSKTELSKIANNQTAEEYAAEQKALPVTIRDGYIKYYFKHRNLELKARNNHQDEVFKENLIHNLPKMMFLLLPLFAGILMLIFRSSKKFYVEHFIYSLHLHSFLFLYFLIPILLGMVIENIPGLLMFILMFIFIVGLNYYIYRSLRTVYNNSRGKTIFKMALLGTSYTVLLGICLLIVTTVTFLML